MSLHLTEGVEHFTGPRKRPLADLKPIGLRLGALLLFAAIFLIFALNSPLFLRPGNLFLIVSQSAILTLLAIGLTIVVITGGDNALAGGIDLSLAANMGLSAAVYASLAAAGQPELIAIVGALLTGLAIGSLNAFSVAVLGMLPLLATLAAMTVVKGVEQVLTGNATIIVDTGLRAFLNSTDPLFHLPILAWALLGLTAIFAFVLHFTPLGLNLQAVGANPLAARAVGLKVQTHIGAAYITAGLCGGLGGIFSASFLGASTNGSEAILLPVIAATFLGTVFSRRLVPTIGGTLLAALFLGMLANGFQLLNVSSYWVAGIQGVLTLAVVAATSMRKDK